jgi:DNA-binding transcriptional regulator YiaG
MTIREIIKKHGGPAEFARLLHIPLDTVKNWSCGRRVPSASTLGLVKAALAWKDAQDRANNEMSGGR